MWDSFELLIWWTLHIRQIHATIVDIFQPRWAHHTLKVHSSKHPGYELFDSHRNILFFHSNKLFTFFMLFVKFWKLASNSKITFYLQTTHAHTYTPKEIFFDRILEIIWHFIHKVYTRYEMEILQKQWLQARNAFFLSFARSFVLFFTSVQLQTTNYDVNFHSLWLFFVLFTRCFPFYPVSQPHPSYSFRCIFIRFFVWARKKERIK